MAEIKLGQNNRTINTNTLKGGIKREDLKTEVQKKIFDALNSNAQGQTDEVLDAEEINNIMNYLIELSGDDLKLGKRDAKKFFKELNLENLSQEDLFDFIEQLSKSQGDIVQSSVQELDGQRVILTVRENDQQNEDGSHQLTTTEEQINTDGTSQINVTTTTDFNTDDKMTTSKSVMHSGETITRSYLNDAGEIVLDSDGNEILQKETTVSGDTTTVTEFDYKGNKFYETVTYGKDSMIQEEYEYVNINGEQKRLLAIETKGDNTTYYAYDNKGNLIRQNSANGVDIRYKYDDAGNKIETIVIDDNTVTRSTIDDKGYKTETVYENAEGRVDDDNILHVVRLDNMKATTTRYNSEGKKVVQIVQKDGKEYTVTYDGARNTQGIVVQFGETPEKIAAKFDCDANKLIKLNGGRQAFGTGATIKIPGELQADTEALQGRGTSAEELQKQQNYQARVARQQAAQAECDARVVVSYKVEDEVVYVKGKGFQSIYDYELKTADGIVKYLYHQEGQHETTATSFNARLAQLKKENPGRFDSKGKLINPDQPLKLPVNEALAQKWNAEYTRDADRGTQYKESSNSFDGGKLASKAHKAISGVGTDIEQLDIAVNGLTADNVKGFIEGYNGLSGESFIKAIRGESKINGETREATYIEKLKSTLLARSKALGLNHTDLLNSINVNTSTKDIEEALNRVIVDINTIEAYAPSERASVVARLNGALNHDDVVSVRNAGVDNKSQANKILEAQLKQDGFFGDLYEGLKWCVGSDQLDEKVKADINNFQTKLNNVVTKYNSTHNIEDFKNEFKAQFGIDCDPNLVKQYTNLSQQIKVSQQLDFVEKYFENHERLSETQLRKLFTNLQKENPNVFGEGVDVNSFSKQEMNNVINSIVNNLREQKGNTLKTTGQLQNLRQNVSRQLFGTQNDVIFRSMDYADSQRQGAGYLKMGTKIVAAIVGGVLTGGVGGAAIAAGTTSLGIDVADAEYRHFVNGGEHMSLDEFGHSALEALTNSGMVLAGGAYYKYIGEIEKLSKLAKAGTLMTMDVATGAGVEKVMTGEITIEGTVFNALFSAAGHCIGLKPKKGGKVQTEAPRVESVESSTPVLDKATKHVNSDGTAATANPSQVHVGEPKAQDISREIDQLIGRTDVTPQELAVARKKLDAIANREVRESLLRKLDEYSQTLPEAQHTAYDQQVREDLKTVVDKFPDKHYINEGDGRVLREYADRTNDINELTALRDRINGSKPGGEDARRTLETRIKELSTASRSAEQIHKDIHAALDKAIADGKGLPSYNDLKNYIASTTDPAKLNDLFDKWIQMRTNCGKNKGPIDKLFKDKGLDIQNPKKRLNTESEMRTETDTKTRTEAEPEIKTEAEPEVKTEVKTEAKTSEEIHQSVAQDIDAIDVEIPNEHKSAWTQIKNELNDIQASLRNGAKNLGNRCKSVLQNLQNLASKLSIGTAKAKIQKLIEDLKLQLMDKGIMKPKNCTLTKSIVNADGTTRTVEFTYDNKGLETKRVYKNQDGTFGGEVNYTYDANNKVKSEVLKDIDGNITENYYQDGEIAKTVRKDAEGNFVSQVDLKDEIFVSVEKLKPENIQAFLKEKNINPEELMFNGNGAIKYTKDGITYQIHYKDGKLTALRIKDIGGNKSYYAYDVSGKKSQISRDEFLDLKTASDRARTTAAQEAQRAQQAKESAYTRGQFDSNDYTGRTIDELRVSMQEKLNLFSGNSQRHILDSLMSTNSCRLQKNGVEYQFTRNNRTGKVTVNEYKINEKYNINEIKHDKYNTEKTYEVENANDIYWAIIDKLNIFSDNTKNGILTTLKKGEVFTCTKNGIHYEFSINNNKISVKECNYQAYQHDYYRSSRSSGTDSKRPHGQESSNSGSGIPKSPKKQWETGSNTYTDEQLGILEYFIDNYTDKIQHKRLASEETSVLAKLLDIEPNDIITLQKGKDSPEAKRLYRQLSIKYHPDKNINDKVSEELIKIISSLYN